MDRFREFALLVEYIDAKSKELADYNTGIGADSESAVNLRRLTNLGTFRAYVINYLRHHPKIHGDMTLLVRQLQPGPTGIPIEIYTFTNTTDWGEYESIQADIFDHLLAITSEFGLKVFQQPAGTDLAALAPGQ